jgi:glycerophosphoryl diester phosphodiesterase
VPPTVRRAVTVVIGLVVGLVPGLGAAVGASPVASAAPAPREAPPPDVWLQRRPLAIAHAGGDLEAPHETMFAYVSAVRAGADVLELDVRLSKDGQLMVVHDDTVDRTTNATGPVRDRTAAELQALDNAYWFVPGCWSCHDRPDAEYRYRGVRTGAVPPPRGFSADDFAIPTLRQVLDRFPDRLLDIEVKDGPDGMAAAEQLAAVLAQTGRGDRVTVASFDDAILDHFKALAPAVATSPGLGRMTEWFFDRVPMPEHAVLQVPPVYSGLTVVSPELVADAHRLGLAVHVWFNGNDDDVPAEWDRLLDMGVDGLITGKPRLLQQELARRAESFRTAFTVTGPLRTGFLTASLPVRCPPVAADRCRAVVLVGAPIGPRGTAVLLGIGRVDLAPGTSGTARLIAPVPPGQWRRAARAGLAAVFWADGPDTAGGVVPITLR